MSFYYEAEAPVWQYKERYGDWKKFPKRPASKLEKLYKKIYTNHDTSVVEYTWEQDSSNIFKVNVQTMSAHNQSSYYRNSEVSREGYPYPTPGNKTRLKSLYDQYYIEEEALFDVAAFFNALGVSPDGVDSLIVFGMMELDSFASITKAKFVEGLSKCGCSSLRNVKDAVTPIKNAMQISAGRKVKVLKGFASWLFEAAKADPRQRTLETKVLQQLLELVCDPAYFPLCPSFLDFFKLESDKKDGDRKTCSRDDWVMVVEFLAVTNSYEAYDDDQGWPLIIGECFDFTQQQAEN